MAYTIQNTDIKDCHFFKNFLNILKFHMEVEAFKTHYMYAIPAVHQMVEYKKAKVPSEKKQPDILKAALKFNDGKRQKMNFKRNGCHPSPSSNIKTGAFTNSYQSELRTMYREWCEKLTTHM